MKTIVSEWYDVKEFLPGNSVFVPVRCINKDESIDFYSMAYFSIENDFDGWHFFEDEYNTVADRMQVTHWSNTITPEVAHKFNQKGCK